MPSSPDRCRSRFGRASDAFADQFLASGPQHRRVRRVDRIGSDAGADGADQPFGDLRHAAVLAIATADCLGRGEECGPDRCGGALRDRLEPEGRLAFR